MIGTRQFTQEELKMITTVYDDVKGEEESQLFGDNLIIKMISEDSTDSNMRQEMSLEDEIRQIEQRERFIQIEFSSFSQISDNQLSELSMIKKKGPKHMKATNYTRKLCNAHKWDYRHFRNRWQKYSKLFFQGNKELEMMSKSCMKTINTRKVTTDDIVKLFANEKDDKHCEMSYLNCQILSAMLKQEVVKMVFGSKKLGNVKTFYLHVFNKFMRIQLISLTGRLQAR